jgi:gamma-glutamylcyclotransferase
MPESFLNFAYGSNMSTRRLRQRTPSARSLGIGQLAGYRLVCRMRGSDGSAKCDLHETGHAEDIVWGVLYEIAVAEKSRLDQAEGLGRAYDYKVVHVRVGEQLVEAGAYVAIEVDDTLLPYDWYLAFVLAGAEEHGLPGSYAEGLKALSTVVDPDTGRRERNLAVLRKD